MSNVRTLEEAYRRGNREPANVILADIGKHGGEHSLQVQWARLTVGHTCATIPGGETCCHCGLAAYPGHRPELTGDVFCPACCPICRSTQTGETDAIQFSSLERTR